MKRLVISLVVAILLISALAGSAFALPLPAQPACDHNDTAVAHAPLPYNMCFTP